MTETNVGRSNESLYSVPISALSQSTVDVLCSFLDPKKVIASPHNLLRDWRGLAQEVRISGDRYPTQYTQYPTKKVLELWQQMKEPPPTLGKLQEILQKMDRWDVFDDTLEMFLYDGEIYEARQRELARPAVSSDVATVQPAEWYTAYVAYAPQDEDFAQEMMTKLREQGFLVCCERDLLPGIYPTVHDVIDLVVRRCKHIILVLSPDFCNDHINDYYTAFSYTHGVATNQRKVIPVVYRKCDPDMWNAMIKYVHKIHYDTDRKVYDFWRTLYATLRVDAHLYKTPATSNNAITPTSSPIPVPTPALTPVSTPVPTAPARKPQRNKTPASSVTTTSALPDTAPPVPKEEKSRMSVILRIFKPKKHKTRKELVMS